MNSIYIDCEYSSFYSPDANKCGSLLQLGAIAVVDGEIKKFCEMCRPVNNVWNKHAEAVHGISQSRAKMQQSYSQLANNFIEWIESLGDNYLTPKGWNCKGDKLYIEKLMIDNNLDKRLFLKVRPQWKDVIDRAKEKSNYIGSKDFKLSSVASFFNIELDAHDALSDAVATMKIDEALSTISLPSKAGSIVKLEGMSRKEKIEKYMSLGYVQIGSRGDIYISEHATENKEALRVILEEVWERFVAN